MQAPPDVKASQAIHLLASINRLGLKAFNTKSKQELIFLILNDTISVVKYQKAALWVKKGTESELLGLSGYPNINQQTLFAKQMRDVVANIKEPETSQVIQLQEGTLEKAESTEIPDRSKILWLPIVKENNEIVGLWLERAFGSHWKDDEIELLSFLMQNYNAAWNKYYGIRFKSVKFNHAAFYAFAILLGSSLWFHIPLPISAPCEVIPKTPIVITSPLEGIIREITVQPGQYVTKGAVLFTYDKRAPLQELQTAKDQVRLVQAQLKKDTSLAFKDKKALEQLAVTKEKLHKEKNQLELAKYRADQLDVKSPINGTVILENPDEWRGNPVHIGEKIMVVSDPTQTKLKIWVPENDNIDINQREKVKVILNVMPEETFVATLAYINTYSALDDKSVPSFVAEAEWEKTPENIKPGLKGTAILYGDDVSIFYWVIRRPWSYVRSVLGF